MSKSDIARLGSFELFTSKEQLKGTPFWTKRETITAKLLQNKPAYRTLTLMQHMAEDAKIPVIEFNTFYRWVQEPISKSDEGYPSVKNFRRTYGHFKQQRLLLTGRNAIDLFLKTEGKGLPN